jgi:hypothetical protein
MTQPVSLRELPSTIVDLLGFELDDHAIDPAETRNLAMSSEAAQLLGLFRAKMKEIDEAAVVAEERRRNKPKFGTSGRAAQQLRAFPLMHSWRRPCGVEWHFLHTSSCVSSCLSTSMIPLPRSRGTPSSNTRFLRVLRRKATSLLPLTISFHHSSGCCLPASFLAGSS